MAFCALDGRLASCQSRSMSGWCRDHSGDDTHRGGHLDDALSRSSRRTPTLRMAANGARTLQSRPGILMILSECFRNRFFHRGAR